jgi:hypothetical protein
MIAQFPFRIRGIHSDNGSEFINAIVARLLQKLLIEQTKSRPRHSNDNGLVETKNGAVIRKHMGYGYIDAAHAERIQQFYTAHFNPYLNYHRPCAQADLEIDDRGRQRCAYRRYQTPLETLLALPQTRTIPAPGTHPRRLATHRRSPQRHRSRPAYAAGQAQTVRAVATAGGKAVAATLSQNPTPKELSSTTLHALPQAHPSIGKDCGVGLNRFMAAWNRHEHPHLRRCSRSNPLVGKSFGNYAA